MASFSYDKMNVQLESGEMWVLIWALKHRLLSVKTNNHFKHYPHTYKTSLGQEDQLMKELCSAHGRMDIYEDTKKEVVNYLAECSLVLTEKKQEAKRMRDELEKKSEEVVATAKLRIQNQVAQAGNT